MCNNIEVVSMENNGGLRSATDNHNIAENANQMLAGAMEKRREEMTIKVFHTLAVLINETAKKGKTHIELNWSEEHPIRNNIHWSEWHICGDAVTSLLETMGYMVYTTFHSDGWRRKSGRIGHCNIYW
jgi:hypothetical protein